MGCHSLLWGIFLTQGLNPGLLHCRPILYHLSHSLPAEGFSCGSAAQESVCNVRDLGLFPGLGRSSEEEKGYPLQHSGLENSMDGIFSGVAKSQTWLSDFHITSLHLRVEPQGKPKNTGVGSLSLLQQIFPSQESNWGLLHCRQILSRRIAEGCRIVEGWSANDNSIPGWGTGGSVVSQEG